MKHLLLISLMLISGLTAQAQEENPLDRAHFVVYQRHINSFSPIAEPFRLLETIRREPLFDNLPFLKLRAGDQLVRGQFFYRPFGKAMKPDAPRKWSEPRVFLQRGGKQTMLYALEEAGRLQLLAPSEISYFDWAPTRANADALFEICRPKPRVSPAQLAILDLELQPEFAEYLGEGLEPMLEKGAEISPGFLYQLREGAALKFVYGGLGCDTSTSEIFQFRLTLGTNGWIEERATLISAPPKPRFSIGPQRAVPSGPANDSPRDPVARRRLEAHDARYRRFETIVTRVLNPK